MEVFRNTRRSELLPEVTIIIPTINRSIVLSEAVRALMLQTESNFEVVVVDNGPSTDDTREKMSSVVENDSRFTYISTTEKGDFLARNIGCNFARAPIIITTDDDWEFTNANSIKYILKEFKENEYLGVIGIASEDSELNQLSLTRKVYYFVKRLTYRPGSITRWGRVTTRFYYLEYGKKHEVDHVKGACMAFRKTPASSFGYFPELYIVDGMGYRSETDLCRSFYKLGYKIIYTTEIVGLHKATPRDHKMQSRSRTNKAVRQWSRNNAIFTCRNYWNRSSAWIYIAYDILIGNSNQPGLFRIFMPSSYFLNYALIVSSIKGKLEGYRIFRDVYYDLRVTK
jgi:glycosyltransferase involved in cell wall biosynthesis